MGTQPSPRHDQAVLVTGASTGIGAACALRLDRRGFQVFAGVRRDADGAALRREASPRLVPLRMDVTDAGQVSEVARFIELALAGRPLAGLVNNAGIAVAGPLEFLPIEQLRAQLEVNVVAVVAVTQAFLPLLRAARGRVVNIGSVSGRSTVPLLGPYSASKHALEALTDALRGELRPWGVEVAIVEPGNIDTPIWRKSVAASDELIAGFPPAAHELYGPRMTALRAFASRVRGLPPDAVAAVVEHALIARRPRTRYVVGDDARMQLLLQQLPDRWRDALLERAMAGRRRRRRR